MKIRFLLLLVSLMAIPLHAHAQRKLHVVASFSVIGDMVRQVAGENVDLKTLVAAGGNVHEYEPTTADARILANADIVFVNGLGLEGWIKRLIVASGYKGRVITLTRGVAAEIIAGQEDPHAWQDPRNAITYATNIRDALIAADTQDAGQYRSNADAYVRKLLALDAWGAGEINKVPKDKRKVICQHDSFGYFAQRYGVEFISPLGVSMHGQPSAAMMARIIDQVRKQKITAVFLENMSDPRMMRQLQEDAGGRIGGTLYSDSLSSPSGPAPDYITMFRHNVTELVSAMQGKSVRR